MLRRAVRKHLGASPTCCTPGETHGLAIDLLAVNEFRAALEGVDTALMLASRESRHRVAGENDHAGQESLSMGTGCFSSARNGSRWAGSARHPRGLHVHTAVESKRIPRRLGGDGAGKVGIGQWLALYSPPARCCCSGFGDFGESLSKGDC